MTHPAHARRGLPLLAALALSAAAAPAPLDVTLIFDAAGRADQATNQSASDGLERAVRDHGFAHTTQTAADAADALRLAREAARSGSTLVIAVGKLGVGALTGAAREFPGTRFVGVDSLPTGLNTAGLRFREQEGGFLAGYLAANRTSTRVLGVVTVAGDPASARYRAGFEAGVALACPGCRVLQGSVPAGGNTFAATSAAKKLYARGADILLAAAGSSNRGVVDAATFVQCLKAAGLPSGVKFSANPFQKVPKSEPYRADCRGDTRPALVIGTESDLNNAGDTDADPATLNHTLASVVKRVDNAVYAVLTEAAKGSPWRTGERGFGLENGGLELTRDRYNKALIPGDLQAKLDQVRRLILSGVVRVPRG